jgi:hypothetical protein
MPENEPVEPPDDYERVQKILETFSDAERKNLSVLYAKYCNGETAKWQEEKLIAKGIIIPPKQDTPQTGELPDAESQASLAAILAKHFAGRIAIDISEQQLGHWRKGRGLSDGTPPPPPKVNNRFPTKEIARWIEQYILPSHTVIASAGEAPEQDVFRLAARKRAEEEVDNAAITRINRQVIEGSYQPVEKHLRALRFIGTILNQNVTAYVERGIAGDLLKVFESSGLSPDQKAVLASVIQPACQNAADALRASLAAALRKAAEETYETPSR